MYLNELERKWGGGLIDRSELFPSFETAELRLELSNICNHACLFCPNRVMNRKKSEMSPELIGRLIEEGCSLGIKKIGLFMNGEPFVTKRLEDWVKYAHDCGYEYIYITTNGSLADKTRIEKVMENGCSSIKFSINAGSRETYALVHQRDDYDKVMQNVKDAYFVREKNNYNCRLLSSFVVTKYTVDEVEKHYNILKPYVDDIVFFNCEDFAGQMHDEVKKLRVENLPKSFHTHVLHNNLPCKTLWNSINITCEGYLTLCCSEAFNYLVVEDVNNQSIEQAWHSDRMIELRKRHLEKDVRGLLCEKCIYKKDDCEVHPINEELYNNSKR